ncbi:MAG: GDP-mannose dehydrogenase [Acidobacteria bacterium]|nr:MAG: GDP-mannose dehydrogenase [Acidobacteriota bacterium]
MNISIFGMGYVGLVTAACLAKQGHRVIGVDINQAKIEQINSGHSPFMESSLDEIVRATVDNGALRATNSAVEAVLRSDISMVCVGTPTLKTGRLDVSGIEKVAHELGRALRHKDSFHTVAIRSTILPGKTEELILPILEAESGKRADRDFALCYNPEFMREGTSVRDFYTPPFTVIGARDTSHAQQLSSIYSFTEGAIICTAIRNAEMLKYVCNAFHALKIAFANEVGTLAHNLGVDPYAVMEVFLSDRKLNISSVYLRPGFAFGGSCLPKDLRAMLYCSRQHDLELPLLSSILRSNDAHLERALDLVLSTNKKHIAVLGLSFKAGTDDLRESAIVELVKSLLGEGRQVKIYDPQVNLSTIVGANREFIEQTIPHIGALLQPSLDKVIEDTDVVLVSRDADEFANLSDYITSDQIVIPLSQVGKIEPSHATDVQMAAA